MKHLFDGGPAGAMLLLACGLLCGCAMQGPLESGGKAEGDTPVATLALSVNVELAPEVAGDAQDRADIQRFLAEFARNVSADLPTRLGGRGVRVRAPGRGVPLLRLYSADYRQECHHTQTCEAQLRIDGALIDSGGSRVWWFSQWLVPANMKEDDYEDFYKHLLDRMVKDQVIFAG
jgi:hypothetical protein